MSADEIIIIAAVLIISTIASLTLALILVLTYLKITDTLRIMKKYPTEEEILQMEVFPEEEYELKPKNDAGGTKKNTQGKRLDR